MWGMGYLYGVVTLLRARYSSQGSQSPAVFFGAMWSGEDQLLDEGLMMPSCSMWSNSSLAMRRHSGGRRRALAVTEGPVVVMWCVMVCLTSWS